MPFASEAQRRKFLTLLKEGKISQETFDKWEQETDRKKLLPRLQQKPKSLKPRKAKVIR